MTKSQFQFANVTPPKMAVCLVWFVHHLSTLTRRGFVGHQANLNEIMHDAERRRQLIDVTTLFFVLPRSIKNNVYCKWVPHRKKIPLTIFFACSSPQPRPPRPCEIPVFKQFHYLLGWDQGLVARGGLMCRVVRHHHHHIRFPHFVVVGRCFPPRRRRARECVLARSRPADAPSYLTFFGAFSGKQT